MADDFTRSSLQRLLDLVNTDNPGANLTLNQVTVGVPVAVNQYGRNTRVALTGIAGRGVFGTRTIFYDRLDLATYFGGSISVTVADAQSAYDVLPAILEQHGVNLGPEDIMPASIVYGNNTLYAKASSIGWTGFFPIQVVEPTIQLSSILTTLALNAFTTAYMTETSLVQLLAAINLANGTSLTFADIQLSLPSVIPVNERDASGRDTRVVITPMPDTLYRGEVAVTYKRLNPDVMYPPGFTLPGDWAAVSSTQDVLQLLRERLNNQLRNDEIVTSAVSTYASSTNLVITANSHVWAPGTDVFVDLPLIPLSEIIVTRALSAIATAELLDEGVDVLLAKINQANSSTLTASDISFSNVTAITPDVNGRDTSVVVTAVPGGQYSGFVTITYKRMAVSDFVTAQYRALDMATPTTTAEVLADLDVVLDFLVEPTDFVMENIADNVVYYPLTAAANSLRWTGSVTLEFSDLIDLSADITVDTMEFGYPVTLMDGFTFTSQPMDGFNYPTP